MAFGTASTSDVNMPTSVAFEHSSNLVGLLDEMGISLLVSTYQASKVFTIGTNDNKIQIRFYHFDQPMGLARTSTGVAIGCRRQIWFLRASNDLAPRITPASTFDSCFLVRQSHFTGPIMGHEMAAVNEDVWVVNTLFSCLCTLQPEFSFVPRWRPPFITALTPNDRCHLNGLAMEGGLPRYATALGETDTPAGWRQNKHAGGCLLDVPSGEIVLRGLCMPHSPRLYQGQLFFLDSGHGCLQTIEPKQGRRDTVARLPGYTRGFDFFGRFAFVGLSRIRETAVFGGLPIAERKNELRCGVSIVDLVSGRPVSEIYFGSGVDEIFEVKVLPGFRNPRLGGPSPEIDQTEDLWLAPPLSANL